MPAPQVGILIRVGSAYVIGKPGLVCTLHVAGICITYRDVGVMDSVESAAEEYLPTKQPGI